MKAIPYLFLVYLAAVGCATSNNRIPENRIERQMIGLIEKFDRWDYNGDGQLTPDELSKASHITGIQAEEILRFYDLNNDGVITLRETQSGYQRRVDARP